MSRIPRYLTLGLLIAGSLAAAATAIWLATLGDAFDRSSLREHGAFTRGFQIMVSSPWASTLYGALIGGAVAALLLFVAALVRPWRWPLAAAAVLGAGAVYPVWLARDWAAGFEFVGYRERSPYVAAATQLATGITVYLAVLAVIAVVAALAPRRALT